VAQVPQAARPRAASRRRRRQAARGSTRALTTLIVASRRVWLGRAQRELNAKNCTNTRICSAAAVLKKIRSRCARRHHGRWEPTRAFV
jgi:hypothetical protein